MSAAALPGDIRADLARAFGLTVLDAAPVPGGWLNLKWRVRTPSGDWLVKRFDGGRYAGHRLDEVEAALTRQMAVRPLGVPCPDILPHAGRPIRRMPCGTAYMVMAFCPGRVIGPGDATPMRLRSLGDACGRMHRALDTLPTGGVRSRALDGAAVLAALRAAHAQGLRAPQDTPPACRAAIRAWEPILAGLSGDLFAPLPMGICHEDLSGDNILFDGDAVSAIVDFDRGQYGYRWHDIGRALLSLALDENARLSPTLAHAFVDGYAAHLPLRRADLPTTLRLTWCIEAHWWMRPEVFARATPKTARFLDEMLWVQGRWGELGGVV